MSKEKKIIEKHKLKVSNQNYTRLSYEMVFRDKNHTPHSLTDEDLNSALNENNREWENRLQNEIRKHSDESYKKGYEDGIKDSSDIIEEHLQPVREAFNEVNESFSVFMTDLKPHITSLVFELTEKVLQNPINDPDLKSKVQDDIIGILNELDDGVKAKIYLAEDDYNAFGDLIGSDNTKNDVTLAIDENMKPGEYKIETAYEMIMRDFNKILQDLKESTSLDEVVKTDVDAVVHK